MLVITATVIVTTTSLPLLEQDSTVPAPPSVFFRWKDEAGAHHCLTDKGWSQYTAFLASQVGG